METKAILCSSPRYWSWVKGFRLNERRITYMSLNQNSVCDSHCRGCFRYPSRKEGLKQLLQMDDYERLLREFKEAGGLAIEISGEGEPLESQLTFPIIRLASTLGLWTTLITNGHALTRDNINELLRLRVALVLSMHAWSEERYESDSGVPGSFSRKKNVIRDVDSVFTTASWSELNYYIKRHCIHWTLQSDNLSEVRQAMVEIQRYTGFHFSVAPLAKVGHAAQADVLWLDDDSHNLKDINQWGDESIIFYDEPGGRQLCGTCKYGLNVGADGRILLDAHGGYEAELPDIREVTFEKALDIQKRVSERMFRELSCFCPIRDSRWQEFLDEKKYLK